MKSYILPAIAGVVLLLATVSIAEMQPVRKSAEPPVAPPRSDYADRVAAVGLVEASSENISIGSELPGVVEKVYVTVGEDVKAGAPLFKMDTRALEASLAEREAAVATARAEAEKTRASLDDVQRNLKFAESVSDPRSVSAEEVTHRRDAVEIARTEVQMADAEVLSAEADLKSVNTDLDRSTVTAPIDARVLQVKIHPGEYAIAGEPVQPWLVLGNVTPLNVRVDIDESEAWRVRAGAQATAQVRGNANLATPVTFVRFEPFVVPKQSLTGDSTERVDTRVLQAIYRIDRRDLPLFVGQQMDVFIDATSPETALAKK